MKWFKGKEHIPKLPTIEEVSSEIPAISEYLDASRLPDAFKVADSDTLPVIDVTGRIIGIVSEYDLAKVLPEWSFTEDSYRYDIKVADIMTKDVWTEPEYTNIEKLLSSIHQMHTRVIPIVDEAGRYTGKSITRTSLINFLTGMVKPRSLGGLATPIGVYMTDGSHQAGAGNKGLLLTGVAFAGIVIFIQLISSIVFSFIHLPEFLVILIELILFVLILRLTPLVKIHAAEHQTIHAMEKGLPLIKETVRMQPKAHRRCGTNIMVLLVGIQLIILMSYEIAFLRNPFWQFLFLIIGFLLIFSNWRKAGMWLQNHLTTADATDAQIENGIKTGEELLEKHKEDTSPRQPGLLEKIWNMGIIQVLSSFIFVLWIFDYILSLL